MHAKTDAHVQAVLHKSGRLTFICSWTSFNGCSVMHALSRWSVCETTTKAQIVIFDGSWTRLQTFIVKLSNISKTFLVKFDKDQCPEGSERNFSQTVGINWCSHELQVWLQTFCQNLSHISSVSNWSKSTEKIFDRERSRVRHVLRLALPKATTSTDAIWDVTSDKC